MEENGIAGLANHPILAGCGIEHIASIMQSAKEECFQQGEYVYKCGQKGDAFYLLLDGEVALYKKINGKFDETDRRLKGDLFGEVSMLTSGAHSHSAVATTNCRVAKIPVETFKQCMANVPPSVQQLLQRMVGHIAQTSINEAQKAAQQEKLAMIGGMVNSIVHDLKSPFQSISLGTETIGMISSDNRVQKICTRITEQVARMLKMAAELAEFSRGQSVLQFESVNLRELVGRIREDNETLLDKAAVEFVTDIPDINADLEWRGMRRVFQNLISNAIGAMKPGGRISMHAEIESSENLRIIFSDNGPGIPECIRDNFWDPFVTYGKSDGVGLGTAIVKSIILGHGGTIEFTTSKDAGTTFEIMLPLHHEENVATVPVGPFGKSADRGIPN